MGLITSGGSQFRKRCALGDPKRWWRGHATVPGRPALCFLRDLEMKTLRDLEHRSAIRAVVVPLGRVFGCVVGASRAGGGLGLRPRGRKPSVYRNFT